MEIEVKQKVIVPISPWCGNCFRKEQDRDGNTFCALFSRFVTIHKGKFLKCKDCYDALYFALQKED